MSSAFSFYNTGDAWRDWRVLAYGTDISPGRLGSPSRRMPTRQHNQKMNDPIFFIDEQELSMVHIKVIEQINSTFFGASTP